MVDEKKPDGAPNASSAPAGGSTPSPQSAPAAPAAAQPAAAAPQSTATPPATAAAPAQATTPPAPPTDPKEAARKRRIAREQELASKLAEKLGAAVKGRTSFRDQETLVVERDKAIGALRIARDELGFEVLTDVTAVDYLKLEGEHPERFAVVWTLLSMAQEARLRIKAYLPDDDPTIGTASGIWPAADWGEREAYDMYGIEFRGHPHLKRILMPEDYGSFPLRKDYPLRGRGERDNFVVLKRGQKEMDA